MAINKNYNDEDDWEVVAAEEQTLLDEEEEQTVDQHENVQQDASHRDDEGEVSQEVEAEEKGESSSQMAAKGEKEAPEITRATNEITEEAPTTDIGTGSGTDINISETETTKLIANTADESPQKVPPSQNSNNTQQQQPSRNNELPAWLRGSIHKIEQAIQDVDQKHDLKAKARSSVKVVGDSLTKFGDTIQKEATTAKATLNRESVKLSQTIQKEADKMDWTAKSKAVDTKARQVVQTVQDKTQKLGTSVKTGAVKAGEKVKTGASKAGTKVKTLHKEGKVTELLATVAVVGGAVLLAKGKHGAGAAMMATGGAAYAADQANQRRYDEGLNEDLLHLE